MVDRGGVTGLRAKEAHAGARKGESMPKPAKRQGRGTRRAAIQGLRGGLLMGRLVSGTPSSLREDEPNSGRQKKLGS